MKRTQHTHRLMAGLCAALMLQALPAYADKAPGLHHAGAARSLVLLPVPVRTIDKGEVIDEVDLVAKSFPETSVRARAVRDADTLIGKVATRTLRAEQPIYDRAVASPILVKKGEVVSVIYRSGAIEMTLYADAMMNGAAGDMIRLQNRESLKIILAQVQEDGTVEVVSPHAVSRTEMNEQNTNKIKG